MCIAYCFIIVLHSFIFGVQTKFVREEFCLLHFHVIILLGASELM